MRITVVITAALLVLASGAGCPQQQRIAVTPEQPLLQQQPAQGRTGAEGAEGTGGVGSSDDSVTGRQLTPSGQQAGQAGDDTPLQELDTALRDIYFDYDKYDIRDDAKPVVADLASRLAKDGRLAVIIEGHCDDRGTGEYNLALGDRRANAVKTHLMSLGVAAARMRTISYGEEKPLCSAATEECWAKNRRAHFVLALPKQ